MHISHDARVVLNLPVCFLSCRTQQERPGATDPWSMRLPYVTLSDTASRFFLVLRILFLQDVFNHSDWCLGSIVRGQFIPVMDQGTEIGSIVL